MFALSNLGSSIAAFIATGLHPSLRSGALSGLKKPRSGVRSQRMVQPFVFVKRWGTVIRITIKRCGYTVALKRGLSNLLIQTLMFLSAFFRKNPLDSFL